MATLGFTGTGASNTNYIAGAEVISNLGGAMPGAGTLDSVVVYTTFANNTSREVVGIVYDDSGGSPNTRVALTGKFNAAASPATITCTAGSEALSAAQYYAGIQMESGATNLFFDSDASYNEYTYNGTWNDTTPAPSNPFSGSLSSTGRQLSIYINYTPSATTSRGAPFNNGTAFNGGRTFTGNIR